MAVPKARVAAGPSQASFGRWDTMLPEPSPKQKGDKTRLCERVL